MSERGHEITPGRESSAYELDEPALPRPPLPGEVLVSVTVDELIDRLAADLVIHAENCVREFGDFHLALSGGETFDRFYQRLMYDPNYRRMPWQRTHLWLVEERCVSLDDARSSYRMIDEIFGDHAGIPAEQVHPIFAMSETADTDYEAQIREALAWREKGQDRLDFVMLTMGPDGETAGLLPGALRDASDQKRFVRRIAAPDPTERDAVSMTPSLINASRFVAVLVTGAELAPALRRLVENGVSADDMPIAGIVPINGELHWYLDGTVCGIEE